MQRNFSLAGTIKKIHMGKFKPRASKKKSKRTVYFGLVVYKDARSVEAILGDSKFL